MEAQVEEEGRVQLDSERIRTFKNKSARSELQYVIAK